MRWIYQRINIAFSDGPDLSSLVSKGEKKKVGEEGRKDNKRRQLKGGRKRGRKTGREGARDKRRKRGKSFAIILMFNLAKI